MPRRKRTKDAIDQRTRPEGPQEQRPRIKLNNTLRVGWETWRTSIYSRKTNEQRASGSGVRIANQSGKAMHASGGPLSIHH